MKVLMTADAVGGVWTYAMELSRALGQRGVSVALATMGPPPSDEQRRQAALNQIELYDSAYKLEWMDEPWEDVARAGVWLRGVARQVRPDLVHLNGYSHAALDWQVPVLTVAHSCVCSWWRSVKGEPAPAKWDRYRRAVAAGLNAANRIVAPTYAMLRALQGEHSFATRAEVIWNGRDLSTAGPTDPAERLPEKRPLIFSAGRLWDEAKNTAALDAVAQRLFWPVYVAGDEHQRSTTGGARRLGRLDDASMLQWMDRASIYALPARYEPFGLSILEAALSGCALVLGDIPTLRELWDGAAVFVDPNDHPHLVRAINALTADRQRRGELAARARDRAARFTTAPMARAYHELYTRLISEHTQAQLPDTLRRRTA